MKLTDSDILIGCIADDFTGASDAASFLVQGGLKTVMLNGIPETDTLETDCQAVVIALKTRTQEKEQAVKESLTAAKWLKERGARQLYLKYCSTFDSTKEGNIGPVADALLEEYHETYTIICPALPVNQRTVRNGNLLVDGIPLHETSMRSHPLTPMWDCDLKVLMETQSKYKTMKLKEEELCQSKEIVRRKVEKFGEGHKHFYVIPDYFDDSHGIRIAELFGDLSILTGSSGILFDLAKRYGVMKNDSQKNWSKTEGKALILAGSCSEKTLNQIQFFKRQKGKCIRIYPDKLIKGIQTEEDIWKEAETEEGDILIYSSDNADKVKEFQQSGVRQISEKLENTMGYLAQKAIEKGYKRLIVAGGETSGAVVRKLGYHSFIIGESVAPGVPIITPSKEKSVRLVLKSGNFGQEDFFLRALDMMKKG